MSNIDVSTFDGFGRACSREPLVSHYAFEDPNPFAVEDETEIAYAVEFGKQDYGSARVPNPFAMEDGTEIVFAVEVGKQDCGSGQFSSPYIHTSSSYTCAEL